MALAPTCFLSQMFPRPWKKVASYRPCVPGRLLLRLQPPYALPSRPQTMRPSASPWRLRRASVENGTPSPGEANVERTTSSWLVSLHGAGTGAADKPPTAAVAAATLLRGDRSSVRRGPACAEFAGTAQQARPVAVAVTPATSRKVKRSPAACRMPPWAIRKPRRRGCSSFGPDSLGLQRSRKPWRRGGASLGPDSRGHQRGRTALSSSARSCAPPAWRPMACAPMTRANADGVLEPAKLPWLESMCAACARGSMCAACARATKAADIRGRACASRIGACQIMAWARPTVTTRRALSSSGWGPAPSAPSRRAPGPSR